MRMLHWNYLIKCRNELSATSKRTDVIHHQSLCNSFKMGNSRLRFLYFRLFYKHLTVNNCSIKVADDWIWTQVLCYHKRRRNQLCHNNYSTTTAPPHVVVTYMPESWISFNICFCYQPTYLHRLHFGNKTCPGGIRRKREKKLFANYYIIDPPFQAWIS